MNDHDHDHDDGHGHHHHHHAAGSIGTAFFLNLGFTVVEIIGGFLTNSTAILADAAHDLGDCFALGQAWYFERLSEGKGNARYSYGYKRFSIFGALVSTVLLLVSSLFILSTAIPRILNPTRPDAGGMVLLAIAGVAVNGLAMFRLSKEKGMNSRVVALHLLEDMLGWIAVLVVSIVLLFFDLPVLDPILAVLITLYILSNVVRNLKSMLPVFLQAVPDNVSLDTIIHEIEVMERVQAVHHAHIWSLDGEHNVFTAHLVLDCQPAAGEYAAIKDSIGAVVRRHGLYHSTVEIEFPGEVCRNVLPSH
ncbi:MAG: cation transporter [Chlorobiaceae bacterium]|nr:cation transporter [Chlorobiaceae bacterium]NTW73392.1 cation transporter [Chlorobiaceae bacterium]